VRESAQSWRELLLDLKRRGLSVAPEVAVADGALGFWKALGEVWPTTREQRCWVHKTANVLNKLPKSLHAKAKRALQQIWMAETKKDALVASDVFVDAYGAKYEKAADRPRSPARRRLAAAPGTALAAPHKAGRPWPRSHAKARATLGCAASQVSSVLTEPLAATLRRAGSTRLAPAARTTRLVQRGPQLRPG